MNKACFDLKDMEPVIREVISSGGEFKMIPKGSSMLPLLRDGKDVVILSKPANHLAKFDIALYRRKNGNFVLHRVVGITENSYVMCGDHQCSKEYNITNNEIIGVVSKIYRGEKELPLLSLPYFFYVQIYCRFIFLHKCYYQISKIISRIKRIFK